MRRLHIRLNLLPGKAEILQPAAEPSALQPGTQSDDGQNTLDIDVED